MEDDTHGAQDEEAPVDVSRNEAPAVAVSESDPELEKKKKSGGPSVLFVLAMGAVFLMLAAILVPNFVRARARGSLTACKSNLKNIGTGLEMYSTDWSGKYPSNLEVLTPKYLKTLPECPAAASMTYRVQFGPGQTFNPDNYEDYYYVECHGSNHGVVSVTGNYPSYNGIQGLIERAP